MRLEDFGVVLDHALLQDQTPADHHPSVETYTVLINALSIPPGAYEHRVTVGETGHQTVTAILRGYQSVALQGHSGAYVIGGATAGQCTGVGLFPYGSGGYFSSYMGSYSRLHGDAYLTRGHFRNNIPLRNLWIDGDEVVLEFYNPSGSSQLMTVYGTVIVK